MLNEAPGTSGEVGNNPRARRSGTREPGANRTRNLQLRRLLLYPFELRAQVAANAVD